MSIRPRVAFQGERGAYADLAIERVWGSRLHHVACHDFVGVVEALTAGRVHYGVLPVRNAIIGEIPGVVEAMSRAALVEHERVVVPVVHCLLAPHGATLVALRSVSSHSAALGQCQAFLNDHPWLTPIASYDTAGAARDVALRGNAWEGAIAGEHCASRYGLQVLERGVGDRQDNSTEFVILSLPVTFPC